MARMHSSDRAHPLDTVDRKFRNEEKEGGEGGGKKRKKTRKNGGSIGGGGGEREKERAGKNENCTDTSVSGIFCFSCHR